MSVHAPELLVPTADVLPMRVRRRLGRGDALLPAILFGELMAGIMLGMAWQVASSAPEVELRPVSSAVSSSSPMVVVAPPPPPASSAPPPPRTEPRNPFAMQVG